ncbi:hypothetical protein [Sinomonas sp. ASV322]|uniref:hypothetical protein n=1 Tax=Sinomonas sp. ASV322 TaxID=3041920 RepID=UPI0027DB597C|nr:hypothetical protein [Sinomonas sp. ASV322]MDQ4501786.1 hypothetical protein [Sinomonas sp. ASV322]
MSVAKVLIVARLFFRYFVRKALSAGVLRSRLARIFLGVGVLAGVVVLGAVATSVFREIVPGRRELFLVIQISTTTVVFWSLIAFIFVKILFVTSDDLVRYTMLLPVSQRERSAALALYEFAMVGVCVGGLFLPIAIASLVRLGPDAVPGLLAGIAMTAVTAYLVLSVLYNVVSRVVQAFGGSRLVHVVVLSLMAALTLWYNGASMTLIRDMSSDFLRGGIEFHVVNLFPFLHERLGWPVAAAAFLALTTVMVVLAALTSPAAFPIRRRFVRAAVPLPGLPVWPTVTALARRSEWWIAVVVAYICSVMLWLDGGTAFVYAALILLSQGIYVYAATNRLRLMPGYSRSAAKEVVHMLLGQTIVTTVHAVPISLFAAARPEALADLRIVAIALVSGVVLTTLIAIVFVAENDSPIVVFTGYAVCIGALVSIGAMVGLLQVPGPWLGFGAACAQALAVVYSIVGMKQITRRKRHETAVTGS